MEEAKQKGLTGRLRSTTESHGSGTRGHSGSGMGQEIFSGKSEPSWVGDKAVRGPSGIKVEEEGAGLWVEQCGGLANQDTCPGQRPRKAKNPLDA